MSRGRPWTRSPSGPRRPRSAGMTLLEVMLASAILATALIPVLYSTSTLARAYEKSEQISHSGLLAQCVIDRIRSRLQTEDTRFWKLSDSPSEIQKRLAQGGPEAVFGRFAEEDMAIVSRESSPFVTLPVSVYFRKFHEWPQGPGQPSDVAISEATNPALLRDLGGCRLTVNIYPSTPNSLLDSDLDGKGEWDMADVEVIIESQTSVGPELATYWTTVTRRQYTALQLP